MRSAYAIGVRNTQVNDDKRVQQYLLCAKKAEMIDLVSDCIGKDVFCRTYRPSTAELETRIQIWTLPAVGCAGLFCVVVIGAGSVHDSKTNYCCSQEKCP